MARPDKSRRKSRAQQQRAQQKRTIISGFLHPQQPEEQVWKLLPAILGAAFMVRAIVSLSGDFVIHPDEIMQYLEQAHRLVFGSGVVYWEYFYGARSWIIPGFAASAVWLCKILGLDSPTFYIAAVKLLFCTLSLLIPWGMYMFTRRHWSETAARIALCAGAFWYELAGFAHKPMTEFAAASILFALLAVAPLSSHEHWRRHAIAGALAVLTVALRFQYAPPVALIMLAVLAVGHNKERMSLILGGTAMFVLVGAIEWAAWGAPFYSYYLNTEFNLVLGAGRAGESSILHMPFWILLASGGLIAVAFYAVTENFRRRGFMMFLILLILIPHMLQNHREYRFLFAIIPMWLLIFSDFTALAAAKLKDQTRAFAVAAAALAIVSIAGIFNVIPWQRLVYTGFSLETGNVNFLHSQDPIFTIYRQISKDEDATGVVDYSRPYFNTGGYYYMHREIPFYDISSWQQLASDTDINAHVSHVITSQSIAAGNDKVTSLQDQRGQLVQTVESETGPVPLPLFAEQDGKLVYWNRLGQKQELSDYQSEFSEDGLVLWKASAPGPVREWQNYEIIAAGGLEFVAEQVLGKDAPIPPERLGIQFKE